MTGWEDAAVTPQLFDLCLMELANGKQVRGWFNGSEWEGIRYRGEKIKRWRHIHYDE